MHTYEQGIPHYILQNATRIIIIIFAQWCKMPKGIIIIIIMFSMMMMVIVIITVIFIIKMY